MRYFTSIFLGILTSVLLVWLMTQLIKNDLIVPPEPRKTVDILYDTKIDTKNIKTIPEENNKPPEPLDPPNTQINIDAVNTDNRQHRVNIGYPSDKFIPNSTRTLTKTSGIPSLPKPSVNKPTIQLDYKHPVDYPREAKLRGIEGQVVIENVVDKSGNVIQVRIVDATDREFIKEVKRSARLWKYAMSEEEKRVHRTIIAFNLEDED